MWKKACDRVTEEIEIKHGLSHKLEDWKRSDY